LRPGLRGRHRRGHAAGGARGSGCPPGLPGIGAGTMTALLRLHGITSGYAGIPAVRDLDLEVGEGEVLALLGPNGAGKTTTLLTAAGVIRPMRGTVEAFGRPLHRRLERNARAGLILVPDTRGVFHGLTVRENLAL